jgi:hypothetical protein
MKFIFFLIFSVCLNVGASMNITPTYSTGTWTPVLFEDTSASTGVTYTTQQAKYIKIGPQVCTTFIMTLSGINLGTGAGNVFVSGTPFAITSGAHGGGAGAIFSKSGFTTLGPDAISAGLAGANGFQVINNAGSSTVTQAITRVNLSATSDIRGSICYFTDK